MQIRSSIKNTHLQPGFARRSAEERAERGLLDKLRPTYDRLDLHLDQPEYQNIETLEAANMLGHFTQTMQASGYPWELRSTNSDDKGTVKKGTKISDMDALLRLQSGKPVLFQPLRDLQLDLSSGSLSAIAAAGSAAGTDFEGLTKVAAYSKNAQVSGGNQGFSIKNGEPIVVENLAQLKLLHQMYDPAEKITGKSETAKTAHQFSYFTQKTVGSAYPWRFYVKDGSNTFLRVARHAGQGVVAGAVAGGLAGLAVGGILAWGMSNFDFVKGGVSIGAAVGATVGGLKSAQASSKGTPINAVEALERVLNKKDVVFQETRARSVNVPLVGKLTWFWDQGQGSTVSDPTQLNTFYYMQSQDELPKAEPPKKKEDPKVPHVAVTVLDQSVHHHYQNNPTKVVILDEHSIDPYNAFG